MKTRSGRVLSGLPQGSSNSSCSVSQPRSGIERLPPEVLCKILGYLDLAGICKMSMMCKVCRSAVEHFLRSVTELSFRNSGDASDNYAYHMTTSEMKALFSKCYMLKHIKAFYIPYPPLDGLQHTNVINSLKALPYLKTIEVNDLKFLTDLKLAIPQLEVPIFRKRGSFPSSSGCMQFHTLFQRSAVREIELFDITISCLPTDLPLLERLHLQRVTFKQAFRSRRDNLLLRNLKSFMMNHCVWPTLNIEAAHSTLCVGLAACDFLEVLHLAGNTFDGSILLGVIMADWTSGIRPFSCLKKLVMDVDWDMGDESAAALVVASSSTLETIHLQKSLSKDLIIHAIKTAGSTFPRLKSLKLGYEDEFNIPTNTQDNEQVGQHVSRRPCQLSDRGLQLASEVLTGPQFTSLSINDCPYLNNPLTWITDSERSHWRQLESFTLSQCPAIKLDQLNELLVKLTSLKILNLVDIFPQPLKGCYRVGLSAGLKINGGITNGAVISHPPVSPAPPSLLVLPDTHVNNLQNMQQLGFLPPSDDEDTMVPADTLQGYRSTQVHTGCTTNSQRIHRSRVRLHAHERILIGGKSQQRDVADPRRRRSRRLAGTSGMQLDGDESDTDSTLSTLDQVAVESSHQHGDFSGNSLTRGRPANVYPDGQTTCSIANKVRNRSHMTDSDQELSPAPKRARCGVCHSNLEPPNLGPPPSKLQFFNRPCRNDYQAADASAFHICLKCLKQRCEDARNSGNASINNIKLTRQPSNPNVYHLFDASTGYSRLGIFTGSQWKVKGKQPAKFTQSWQGAGKLVAKCSTATAGSGTTHVQSKGKRPLKLSSQCKAKVSKAATAIDKTPAKRQKGTQKTPVVRRRAKTGPPAVADKYTHTKDPFIEDDVSKILSIEHVQNNITNVNISNCGLTELHLGASRHLVAVTANACPALKQICFATEPWSSPKIVRVTQCPKMSLPCLLNSLSMQNACEGDENSSHVKTVEFEPMMKCDREEMLIELARLPEANKVLVECQASTAGIQCAKVKTFYENLLKDMSGSGRAPYRHSMEFKVYVDEIGEEKVLISHNVPSCSEKLTSYCRWPDGCEVTSCEGHKLHGCTVLCFIYPTVSKKKYNSKS